MVSYYLFGLFYLIFCEDNRIWSLNFTWFENETACNWYFEKSATLFHIVLMIKTFQTKSGLIQNDIS